MTETTTRKTPQKPPDIADLVAEAQKLRVALERAALAGTLDLTDKHAAAAHQRLDELERLIYVARRLPSAEKKS
jgi:hypothetical protein